MNDRPKARTEHLVLERIGDEVVIYDRVNHIAHCLSPDAVAVWELCDGGLSEAEIATELGVSSDMVGCAVGSLRECRLLDPDPVPDPGYSRRQAATKLARIGGAALAA